MCVTTEGKSRIKRGNLLLTPFLFMFKLIITKTKIDIPESITVHLNDASTVKVAGSTIRKTKSHV
jgi:hypothetical protein